MSKKIKLKTGCDEWNKIYYTRDFKVIDGDDFIYLFKKGVKFESVRLDVEEKNEICVTHGAWKAFDPYDETYEYYLIPNIVEINTKMFPSNVECWLRSVEDYLNDFSTGHSVNFSKDDLIDMDDDEVDEIISERLYEIGNLDEEQYYKLLLDIKNIWLGR